jgi:hypothetical protein
MDTKGQTMTADPKGGSQQDDPDVHKGAVEDNRPPVAAKRPGTHGLDENGLPNDPVAIAQDALGAKVDESQG